MKNSGKYQNSGKLLLSDVFEKFFLEIYELDPAKKISAP